MSLTSPPLEDGCKIHDADRIQKGAAALHYLETHGGNILQAMRSAKDNPAIQDDESYWLHELKALAEVFVETGIPETGWAPLRQSTVETPVVDNKLQLPCGLDLDTYLDWMEVEVQLLTGSLTTASEGFKQAAVLRSTHDAVQGHFALPLNKSQGYPENAPKRELYRARMARLQKVDDAIREAQVQLTFALARSPHQRLR